MKVVTLLTDFGDFYPGVVKGVILSIADDVTVVDITNSVEPQNVLQGAFLLYNSYGYFKSGTVHLAVVDPGVGSERAAIAVKTRRYWFIGPDNGILYPSASEDGITKIYEIDDSISDLTGSLSSTFHGRDVFAPAAALVSKGAVEEFDSYFKPAEGMQKLDLFDVDVGDGWVECRIVFIDRFGNLVTNLREEVVRRLGIRGVVLSSIEFPLVNTYSDVERGAPLSLVGSFNTLELSFREGSAAEELGIKKGNVKIKMKLEK